MATVNFIPCTKQNASSMKNEIAYVVQDIKVCIEPKKHDANHTINYQTYSGNADKSNSIRLISGKDCCPETAFAEFMATKNAVHKANRVMFYHYSQSFKDGENISPKTAHEIAVKFAEDNYPDFEVVIATHVDNEHLHSHFIINSVSFKTGNKLHETPKTLLKLRASSDQICKEYGLSTLEPYVGGKSQNLGAREYRAAAKGQSWKFELMNTIDYAMRISRTKAQFICNMQKKGYEVNWTGTRKSITYICPNTMKCRDNKLHDTRYLKERMEREFEYRRIETEKLRFADGESTANITTNFAPDITQPMPDDTGKNGKSVLQLKSDFGRDSETASSIESSASAKLLDEIAVEQSTRTDGTGQSQQLPITASADTLTGWEAEREIFFNPSLAFAESENQPNVVMDTADIGGIMGDVVRLGKAVEFLGDTPPVKDATTKPQPHSGKKKKLAVGQKEDDNSGYDYTMTM